MTPDIPALLAEGTRLTEEASGLWAPQYNLALIAWWGTNGPMVLAELGRLHDIMWTRDETLAALTERAEAAEADRDKAQAALALELACVDERTALYVQRGKDLAAAETERDQLRALIGDFFAVHDTLSVNTGDASVKWRRNGETLAALRAALTEGGGS